MIGIAAISDNLIIGRNGELPWKIPGDLRWFKETTMGHVCIFGKNTAKGLPPLKGREIYTLTRNPTEALQVKSPLDVTARPDQKIFLAGGAQVYEAYLHLCSDLYITHAHGEFEGDTYFPVWWDWGFDEKATLLEGGDFTVKHYVAKTIT